MLQTLFVIHKKSRDVLVFFIFSFFCLGFFLFILQVFFRICIQTSFIWIDKGVSYFIILSSLMASSYAVSEDENIKILLFSKINKNKVFQVCIHLLGFIVSITLLGIFLMFSQISLKKSWIQSIYQIPYLLCFGVSTLTYLCNSLKVLYGIEK